jgi:hypothetical protein
MKKKLLRLGLILVFGLSITMLTSCEDDDYPHPCHPAGDLGPCGHAVHAYDYDGFGNTYPCGHRLHVNDIYPCVHTCY